LSIALIDIRSPKEAKVKLQEQFTLVEFKSIDCTYDAISCHPDVFICQYQNTYIVAPNTPIEYIKALEQHKKNNVFFGYTTIGKNLENSSQYNCIITDKYIFHKLGFTDERILEEFNNRDFIHLPQSYTRCSMIVLPNGSCITSDRGIEKALTKANITNIYCSPENIKLPPYLHGFIGGCMGLHNNNLYILGNINTLCNSKELKLFLEQQNQNYIELHNEELYDGGGIFFIKN